MQIIGIVNVTRDSFSDGGRYLAPAAAVERALQLLNGGAAIIDLGAESTHPDAEDVSAEEEIARLTPMVTAMKEQGATVSIDTYKPAVMRALLALGADIINDVTGMRDPDAIATVRQSDARVIVMHSTSTQARAERRDVDAMSIVDDIRGFFKDRVAGLTAAGIARTRLILDPGMGFFLSRRPEVSLAVLHHLDDLRIDDLPLCVSTSRKSFIGALLTDDTTPRPPQERGAGTLATELWAAQHGAEYIRTHDVRALHDAWRLWRGIAAAP